VVECLKLVNQRLVFDRSAHHTVDGGVQVWARRGFSQLTNDDQACPDDRAYRSQPGVVGGDMTYQTTTMSYRKQSSRLAGLIGLLKMFATRPAHEIADEGMRIFGGRGLTQTGMGNNIEIV
jgi:alkylation response protein AidB-like acyl-CoA dehydrogenase